MFAVGLPLPPHLHRNSLDPTVTPTGLMVTPTVTPTPVILSDTQWAKSGDFQGVFERSNTQ